MMQLPSRALPPSRDAAVPINVVHALLRAVEEAGVPRATLLRAAKIDASQLDSIDARVTRWAVYRTCERALELTGDPAFGLHWGERLQTSAFRPLSELIAHAATLRDAFEAISRFRSLLSEQLGYQLELDERVTVRCLSSADETLPTQRLISEMIVSGLVRLVRYFEPRARIERVCFAYDAPSYRAEYTRVFERAERFNHPFTGIVFDARLMEARSPHAAEGPRDALRSVPENLLRLAEQTPYALRVRDFLVAQAAPQRREMDDVARALGLSARSLRRRLVEEGKSYGAIANEACAIAAKRLLVEGQCTTQEAALQLGFSDETAFYRAFKRWTGTTPSAFRRNAGEARQLAR